MEAHYMWECPQCGFWHPYKGEEKEPICPECNMPADDIYPMHKGSLYWHLLEHGEMTEKLWKQGLPCAIER